MSVPLEERTDSRSRVLDVAEALFMQRGYNAIALRDIAEALGIKQASLYYHFPQGKEELYVAVAEQAFRRHADGILMALSSHDRIDAQLTAVADWFAARPTMCLMAVIHADLPALHEGQTRTVEQAAMAGIFHPLAQAFADAMERGELRPNSPHLLAGAFLALLDAITIGVSMRGTPPRAVMAAQLIDLFLNGARA